MAGKRKEYLYNENVPVTAYAKTKLKKLMGCIEEDMDENIVVNNVELENNTILFENIEHLPEDQLSHQEFMENCRIDYSLNELSSITDDADVSLNNEAFREEEDLYSSDDELYAKLREKKPACNITDMMKEATFFKSLSINVPRSQAEILLMVLKFGIANALSLTGFSNLLKLVNCICGSQVLPDTHYKIKQLCEPDEDINLHAVCPTCSKYVGIFSKVKRLKICENCNTSIDMSNPSCTCFFCIINPSDALRDNIEANDSYYNYIVSERVHEINQIKDIYDGHCYRNFVKSLNETEQRAYATVVFNTDGAPVFESSKFSVWPIYIILNEISAESRFKNAITVGLWYGKKKPEMAVFLEAFVDVMNELSSSGILCKIKDEERRIKIYALLASVDNPARSSMKCSTQYNGHYGCDWCMHEGEYYARSMRYPFRQPLPEQRSHESTIEHAREAIRTNSRIYGIIMPSPLLCLRKFNIIEGFTPDYLHCYLLGVVRQFTNYLVGYLTKSDIEFINSSFLNIRVPYQISRLARSIEDLENWKGREFENWALYYSIPLITTAIHNNRLIKHWTLLVDALHICLGCSISYSQLNQANEMLHKFVREVEDIYSLAGLTYNAHQLLHICKSIKNWGPLWAHCTYPFESANHNILTSIHCSKGVILQVSRYENIQRCIKMLENEIYPQNPVAVIEYCENLRGNCTQKAFKLSNITYMGKEKVIMHDHAARFNISQTAKAYTKIIYNTCVYMNSRKNNLRSCNYFAQLRDGRFVQLIDFIVDNLNEITVCKPIKTKANYYSTVIRDILEFADEICVNTSEIWRICVFIEIKNKMFITPVPNNLHY